MTLGKKYTTYRRILRRNPALYGALQKSLQNTTDADDRDRLFLHVFAPVLTEYIEWVLTQADEDGKKRLYFLARDGWLLQAAAEKISTYRKTNLDCRYLKVSRYAMRQPLYYILGEESLDLLCTSGIDATFNKVMRRAGLSEEEAERIAASTGHVQDRHQVRNYRQMQQLKDELRHSRLFLEYVNHYSKEAYPAAAGYIRQEGLLDDVPYALVDSGWIGTLQQSIERLCLQEKPNMKPVDAYYFGLYEIPREADQRHCRTFYFGPREGLRRKVYFSNSLFEALVSSPEGMTTGYRQVGDCFAAAQSPHRNPNAEFLVRCRELLMRFLDAYLPAVEAEKQPRILPCVTEALLHSFMAQPDPAEVELFGSLQFCDDVLELQIQRVAAELSDDEIRRQHFLRKVLIMLGLRREVIHESAWIEGSIVQNRTRVHSNLRHAAWYKYFVYLRKTLRKA